MTIHHFTTNYGTLFLRRTLLYCQNQLSTFPLETIRPNLNYALNSCLPHSTSKGQDSLVISYFPKQNPHGIPNLPMALYLIPLQTHCSPSTCSLELLHCHKQNCPHPQLFSKGSLHLILTINLAHTKDPTSFSRDGYFLSYMYIVCI